MRLPMFAVSNILPVESSTWLSTRYLMAIENEFQAYLVGRSTLFDDIDRRPVWTQGTVQKWMSISVCLSVCRSNVSVCLSVCKCGGSTGCKQRSSRHRIAVVIGAIPFIIKHWRRWLSHWIQRTTLLLSAHVTSRCCALDVNSTVTVRIECRSDVCLKCDDLHH